MKLKSWIILSVLFILVYQSKGQTIEQKANKTDIKQTINPVAYDAYRMWDRLPNQRIGVRAYMRSTYQRSGTGSTHDPKNPGHILTDASHYLFFNEKEDDNVTLDVKGKGILYFFRANHWHGSPWNFKVDGKDNIVMEDGTTDPILATKIFKDPKFIPYESFPQPLNWTWATTKGADLIWTPMPFRDSFRISYGRTYYGTGYYIYHLFGNEENLSQPINPWNIGQVPDQDVLDLLNRAGTDIAPKNIAKRTGVVKLNKERLLLEKVDGPSVLRALKFVIPLDKALDLERIRLRMTWDNAEHPSIDAPLCLFFGTGTFYNRDEKEYLVKGLPINVRFDYPNKKVELACYYPMPFFKSARVELSGINPDDTEISYEFRYEPFEGNPNLSSYFHATYKDLPKPEVGKEMVFLDTRGIEGHDEWSGSFMGTSFIFSHKAELFALEGDPKFYFDDSQTPQAHGTGTEEWCGGGGFWGGQTMTLPLAGHPVGAPKASKAKTSKDLIQSAYRFLWADLMPFGQRAVIAFEQGDMFTQEHYEAVTYWYGLPAPSLIKTDLVDIGDLSSEKTHSYDSPGASEVETISSIWDGAGVDVFPDTFQGFPQSFRDTVLAKNPDYKEKMGKKIYPEISKQGRFTRSTSEFTINLVADNEGVMLRRVLDYSFPNQTAEVYISDASSGPVKKDAEWENAGVWYLAGATTYLFSWPKFGEDGKTESAELAKRINAVQQSDRRFRDDEFLIPAKLTKGRSAIRVRIKFVPNDQQLYPGFPYPKESAWSELEYHVFCYVIPKFR